MPAADLYHKLSRLVSYKIFEINQLTQAAIDPDEWTRIQKLFHRENIYASSAGFTAPEDPFEKAMWSYYEMLEALSLKHLHELKNQVNEQIKAIEVSRRLGLL